MNIYTIVMILLLVIVLWIGTMVVFSIAVKEILSAIDANTKAKDRG